VNILTDVGEKKQETTAPLITENDKEKEKTLYDIAKFTYEVQAERTKSLDDKLTTMIGFSGVIISIVMGLGTFALKEISGKHPFFPWFKLSLEISLLFFIFGGLFSIRGYWSVFRYPLVTGKARQNKNAFTLTQAYEKEIGTDAQLAKGANDKKGRMLWIALCCMVIGIVSLAISFLVLLI